MEGQTDSPCVLQDFIPLRALQNKANSNKSRVWYVITSNIAYLEEFPVGNESITIHVVDSKSKPEFLFFVTFDTELRCRRDISEHVQLEGGCVRGSGLGEIVG